MIHHSRGYRGYNGLSASCPSQRKGYERKRNFEKSPRRHPRGLCSTAPSRRWGSDELVTFDCRNTLFVWEIQSDKNVVYGASRESALIKPIFAILLLTLCAFPSNYWNTTVAVYLPTGREIGEEQIKPTWQVLGSGRHVRTLVTSSTIHSHSKIFVLSETYWKVTIQSSLSLLTTTPSRASSLCRGDDAK